MSLIMKSIKNLIDKCKTAKDLISFRKEYKENIEIDLGHVPSYNEEQESEIPKAWYEPLKD